MPTSIQVDCLLPNGVIIQLTCYRDSPLEKIKSELWREAQNFPLFHLLKGKNDSLTHWLYVRNLYFQFLGGYYNAMNFATYVAGMS